MRPILFLALLPLAACETPTAPPPAPDLHAHQEAACASAIAAHIGRPVAVVTTRWLSETGGTAQIEAIDGNRRHLCAVDAAGRVLSYSHPPA